MILAAAALAAILIAAGAARAQEKILECTGQAEERSLEPRERRRFMTECLRG